MCPIEHFSFECGVDYQLVLDMTLYLYQIRLIVIGAQNLHDVSTMGKMDAFARIYYGNNSYKTSIIHDSGHNPSMS